MSWLFVIVPVVIILAVLHYHQRKVKAREAASEARFKQMLTSVQQAKKEAVKEVATPTAARPAEYVARPLVLPPQQMVIYFLLKSALPQHVVLAQVSLGALLEAAPGSSGFEREARETRLAGRVDFVVCDQGFKLIAVVNASGHGGHRAALRGACEGAGVHWVDIEAGAPPAQAAVREAVLGVQVR
jgi:hypothetical protein